MVRGAHDRSRSLPPPPGASRSTGHKLLILELQLWNLLAQAATTISEFFAMNPSALAPKVAWN